MAQRNWTTSTARFLLLICILIPITLQLGYVLAQGDQDSDGDGVPDQYDQCPGEAGPPVNHEGCPGPDSDGDGLVDENDGCIDQPGSENMDGCPDSDGDGLADRDDDCPNQPGPVNGCPDPNAPPTPTIAPTSTGVPAPIQNTAVPAGSSESACQSAGGCSNASSLVVPNSTSTPVLQPIDNSWARNNTVYLCLGTEIRVGSGNTYAVQTVVREHRVEATVISNRRVMQGVTWWDIRFEDGSTGWVRQEQADCRSAASTGSMQVRNTVPIDNGSSTALNTDNLQILASPSLNIRNGPNTGNTVIGKASNGGYFEIVDGPENGWYQIRFSGGIGWVNGRYIAVMQPGNSKSQ